MSGKDQSWKSWSDAVEFCLERHKVIGAGQEWPSWLFEGSGLVGGGQMWAELVEQEQRLVRDGRNRSWKDDGWSGVIRGGRCQCGKF